MNQSGFFGCNQSRLTCSNYLSARELFGRIGGGGRALRIDGKVGDLGSRSLSPGLPEGRAKLGWDH